MNFHNASRRRSRYDLTRIFNGTLVKSKPDDAVTFVDNHDTVEGQSLESWVASNFKIQAYALILLRSQGHPCVFYGDLYPNPECYNENIARSLTLLIEARKKFAYGTTVDYFLYKNCIGFVRLGDDARPGCAVILSNKEDESGTLIHTLRMNVGKRHAGATFRSFLQRDGQVSIDSGGWGEFTCFANHVQVWVRFN
jgi:alpha-amylase